MRSSTSETGRQAMNIDGELMQVRSKTSNEVDACLHNTIVVWFADRDKVDIVRAKTLDEFLGSCLLYTSPSPRDRG